MLREQRLSQAFVELADTLVDDFDVVDFMTLLTDRCVELLGATDGGLMLVDTSGDLRVVASSSELMRTLELLELQSSEGPCLDAFRTLAPVGADDLDEVMRLWPNFATHVRRAGYRSIHAVPMRLRSNVIGALTCSIPIKRRGTKKTSRSRKPWPTSPPSVCCTIERCTTQSCCRLSCSPR